MRRDSSNDKFKAAMQQFRGQKHRREPSASDMDASEWETPAAAPAAIASLAAKLGAIAEDKENGAGSS